MVILCIFYFTFFCWFFFVFFFNVYLPKNEPELANGIERVFIVEKLDAVLLGRKHIEELAQRFDSIEFRYGNGFHALRLFESQDVVDESIEQLIHLK